jgi:hypothetical protein
MKRQRHKETKSEINGEAGIHSDRDIEPTRQRKRKAKTQIGRRRDHMAECTISSCPSSLSSSVAIIERGRALTEGNSDSNHVVECCKRVMEL